MKKLEELLKESIEYYTKAIEYCDENEEWRETVRDIGHMSDTNKYFWLHGGERDRYIGAKVALLKLQGNLPPTFKIKEGEQDEK